MPLIGDFVDLIAPVAPSTLGAEVFERFQNEPNTLALAVVDDQGRPLGVIERNAFTLRMAAEFGRAFSCLIWAIQLWRTRSISLAYSSCVMAPQPRSPPIRSRLALKCG